MRSSTDLGMLVLPEAVTVAEVLCDLDWRRHVAMVDNSSDLARFYHRIGRRLGQSRRFSQDMAWGGEATKSNRAEWAECRPTSL
jgi:hypothetical protein